MSFPAVDPESPILEITPGDIKLTLQLNKDQLFELKLRNLTTSNVAYKIKTTAPERYQVRPIQSFIQPLETATCVVALKSITQYPAPDDVKALKHKFLVQSVIYDGETEISQYWKNVETSAKAQGQQLYHDHRISCTLVVPSATEETENSQLKEVQDRLQQKEQEFQGLMELTLRTTNQVKTLQAQLQQKDKEVLQFKKTIAELEKAAVAAPVSAQNTALSDAPKTQGGMMVPIWALAVLFIIGILFAKMFL